MPQIFEIAFWNVVRTSPTLPPRAIKALAIVRMPPARQRHADVVEDGGDRRVRLVHSDLDGADARKVRQDGVGDRAGRAFQELVVGVLERRGRGCDHVGVGDGIRETVCVGGLLEIRIELEIDHEALSDLGLMFHHAMAGMDDKAGHENRIGHFLLSIAVTTRSACKVSATSWVRMIRAPRCAAMTWAAIEPPSRSCGSDGDTDAIKRLREAPIRIGRPKTLSSLRRASAVMLCSGVLPKPMPGSSTMLSLPMPALAAISSER